MIDPITAIGFANEGITKCIEIARIVKKIIEAVKNLRNDLLVIVRRAERTRKMLTIVRSLAQRLQAAGRRDAMIVLSPDACLEVMDQLLRLAGDMAQARLSNRLIAGFQWWSKYKDESTRLCSSIQEQEDELLQTVELLHMDVTLDGLETMHQIKAELESQRPIVDAFDGLTVASQDSSQTLVNPKPTVSRRVWLGYVAKDGQEKAYVQARDALANAAYIGDWQNVKAYIEHGEGTYGETWANAFRLQSLQRLDRLSLWTPLHQAVFNNAPLDTVQWLLDHGASRTLRTRTSEFDYRDMSAFELAQLFGHAHMYEMLRPIVRHAVPYKVLQMVEDGFHALIREDLNLQPDDQYIRLPELEVLAELEENLMWFPLRNHNFDNAGYAFRLDGRDLIVLAQNISKPNGYQVMRITKDSVDMVEKALLINDIPK